MEHLLDNTVWNALNTGNRSLALGTGPVRYFSKDVSPFVALSGETTRKMETLYRALPFERVFGFVTPDPVEFTKPWQLIQEMEVYQMILTEDRRSTGGTRNISGLDGQDSEPRILPLVEANIPEMLELTKLTNPGPFFSRTIDFGHYTGIFEKGRLAAMAGQRLHPLPFAEISAVCTHPDFPGKGYASRLLQHHIDRILAAGETPFLHVKTENTRAIEVYKKLGFVVRKPLMIYLIRK